MAETEEKNSIMRSRGEKSEGKELEEWDLYRWDDPPPDSGSAIEGNGTMEVAHCRHPQTKTEELLLVRPPPEPPIEVGSN